jgi:hypothetical protein
MDINFHTKPPPDKIVPVILSLGLRRSPRPRGIFFITRGFVGPELIIPLIANMWT